MSRFDLSTKHASFDASTRTFSPALYRRVHIPSDQTIDQFLFSYSPDQARKPGEDGEGHFRPKPEGQTWLVDSMTGRKYSHEDCQMRTEALAQAVYRHLSLRSDQVVLVCAPNDIDYPPLIWATFRSGGIISGVNPSSSADELIYQLSILSRHFTVAGLVCHPDTLQTACKAAGSVDLPLRRILLMSSSLGSEVPSGCPKEIMTLEGIIKKYKHTNSGYRLAPYQLKPGEAKRKLAFLSFSSGTTGLPKAVCIPHYSVISNMIQTSRLVNRDNSGESTLAILPYYHIFGLVVILHSGLYRNLANVVVPKFVFENFLDCLIRYKPSTLYLVPPVVVLLAKNPLSAIKSKNINRAVKQIFSGAAPLTQELVSTFRERFPDIQLCQVYGMTETSTMVTSTPPMEDPSPGSSAGVLCPNVRMKIISQAGEPVGFGQMGEILVQSPSNALQYLANPKANSETFLDDGYVRTGDEGYIDDHGWVYVVERLKELIKVKGHQVAPAELEGHILGHPCVADVCVIGIPDEMAGELPRAYVVKTEAAQREDPVTLSNDIKKFVANKKIRYKWLDGGVQFVDLIPKSPSGKILRRQLKANYNAESESKPKL